MSNIYEAARAFYDRPLTKHIYTLEAAIRQALPILEEVVDADIIGMSRAHYPGATEVEHLASMESADRAETERVIAARDACRAALQVSRS